MANGYSFGGKRAQNLRKRLAAIKKDPEAARAIMAGKRPKDYPAAFNKATQAKEPKA